MIYLENITDRQRIYIPVNGVRTEEGNLSLTLRNTVDRTEYAPSVNMARGKSGIYLRLYVKLPAGMPDGSYEYELSVEGGTEISSGCMMLGVMSSNEIVQYHKTAEYIQYGAKQ